MNTTPTSAACPMLSRLTPAEHAALMDQARARALQARREAADAFWTAASGALANTGRAVTRRIATFMPRRAPVRALEG